MTEASNPLARLIDEVKAANPGWSDTVIVARARRAGHQKLSKSAVSGYRNQGVMTLVPETLRALAAGLGVPVTRVLNAALEAAGLPVGESSTPESAILADPTLSERTKRMLLTIIQEDRRPSRPPRGEAVDLPPEMRAALQRSGSGGGDQVSERDDMTL